MSARFTIDQLPKRIQDQVARELNAQACSSSTVEQPIDKGKVSGSTPDCTTRLKADPQKAENDLNKTEAAFLDELRSDASNCFIGIQALTLRLADTCRYTPDFTVIKDGKLIAYEVKGFWRDDARVKIKVAARSYPWIKFIAVQKDKSSWKTEEFFP